MVPSTKSEPRRSPRLHALLRLVGRMPSMVLMGRLLASERAREGARRARGARARAVALFGLILNGRKDAIRDYDALLETTVAAIRGPLAQGRVLSALAALDRRTLVSRSEYGDAADVPLEARRSRMQAVAFLNEGLDSYSSWVSLMRPDLASTGRPTRILALSAGHGGFAMALKARFGERIDVTVSDAVEGHLELGREEASRRGLDVAFVAQDPTDLGNLASGSFDVVVCTQTLHHFSPGAIARMLSGAARVASRAVWMIDGERSLVGAIALSLVVAAYSRSWHAVHDTFVSLRKMYTEEELAAIAMLAPCTSAGCRSTSGRVAPGFVYLRLSPWRSDTSSIAEVLAHAC